MSSTPDVGPTVGLRRAGPVRDFGRLPSALAGAALLLLLSLVLHLAADLAWLGQAATVPPATAATRPADTRAAADPHEDGAVPNLARPAACARWSVLAAAPRPLAARSARPPLLHPPQPVSASA